MATAITMALAVLVPIMAGGLLYTILTVSRQGDEIQQQHDAILGNCLEQNTRHDETIRALDDAIAGLPPDRRQRAQANRDNTVALIDALAPKRDCRALAARQTGD